MRRLLPLLFLLAACGAPSATPNLSVDTPALRAAKAAAHIQECPTTTAPATGGLPKVTLPCLGGGPSVALASLRGPMVINLWAHDCGPCRLEMPVFQQFAQKHQGQVAVLGVDYVDVRPDLAIDFAKTVGATYPQLASLEQTIQTNALPTTIFIDAAGKIVFQQPVAFDSVASLEKLVSQKLGVAS